MAFPWSWAQLCLAGPFSFATHPKIPVRGLSEPGAVMVIGMKHEPCSEQIVLRLAPTLRDEIERAASGGRSAEQPRSAGSAQ